MTFLLPSNVRTLSASSCSSTGQANGLCADFCFAEVVMVGANQDARGRFKKGCHWRPRKLYWDKAWLANEYLVKGRTHAEIAAQFGITENAIWFWVKKHGISCRTMSETRAEKHWGASGEANAMYGKRGAETPSWKGGVTPERQAFYSSQEWVDAVKAVWKRDKATCQRCGARKDSGRQFHIHHIVTFAVKELRGEPSNLVLLCKPCHNWVHSRHNTENEWKEVTDVSQR